MPAKGALDNGGVCSFPYCGCTTAMPDCLSVSEPIIDGQTYTVTISSTCGDEPLGCEAQDIKKIELNSCTVQLHTACMSECTHTPECMRARVNGWGKQVYVFVDASHACTHACCNTCLAYRHANGGTAGLFWPYPHFIRDSPARCRSRISTSISQAMEKATAPHQALAGVHHALWLSLAWRPQHSLITTPASMQHSKASPKLPPKRSKQRFSLPYCR